MARPFALWGLSVYGALFLAAVGGPDAARAVLWICTGASVCLVCLRFAAAKLHDDRRLSPLAGAFAERAPLFAVACLLMAAALALFLWETSTQVQPARRWADKESTIKARVLDYPEKRYHRYYYRLRVEEIDKTTVRPFTVRLSAAMPLTCEPYDWVECQVKFYAFETEGAYSQSTTLLADGYPLGAFLMGPGGTRIPCGEDPPGKVLAALRKSLARKFSQLLPGDDAGLLQAMLLGSRDCLLAEAYEDFRLIGCSHLLVVSGLHMGAVAGLVSLLLRRTRLRRPARTLLSAAVLLGYLCVTGFPVSGVRAFIMCAVYLLGGCFGRQADSVNSLGLALLLICLRDPFSGGDLSLALSAFATLGIILLSPKIQGALLRPLGNHPKAQRLCKPIAGGLSVTLSAMAATAPWQILAFRGVSLLSPLANLLLTVPCTLLLYCALLTLVFSLIPGLAALARPFAFCAGLLGRLARYIAGALAGVPRAYVYLGPVQTVLLLGALFILVLLFISKINRLRRLVTAGLMALFLIFFAAWQGSRTQGMAYVAVCGSADDACIAIIQDNAAAVLQAGAKEGDCVSLLRRNQVGKVTALFLPEDGAPERLSAGKITAAFPIGQLVLPEGTYIGRDLSPEATGAAVSFLPPGGRFEALPGVTVSYDEDGSLRFLVNSVAFSVEFAKDGPILRAEGTNRQKSFENSSFTVLLADDIIDVAPGSPSARDLLAGRYVRPQSADGLRLAIAPDGSVTVQEGS